MTKSEKVDTEHDTQKDQPNKDNTILIISNMIRNMKENFKQRDKKMEGGSKLLEQMEKTFRANEN